MSTNKTKTYDELNFTDDFLFSKIMRDPVIAKGVVETLLDVKVGKIKFLTSQYTIEQLYNGKGVRLDAYLEDSDRMIDIEIQTVNKRNEGLRIRYYQSIMDIEHLNSGESYEKLKETYVIFLCLHDPFGKGSAVYNFETYDKELNLKLNDRIHKVIYNAESFSCAKKKNIKAFLEFLNNHKASDSLTERIQAAVENSKGHEPWRAEYMLWRDQVREWKDEAREEGLAEGLAEGLEKGIAEGLEKGLAEGLEKGLAEGLAKGREQGIEEGKLLAFLPFVKYLVSEGKSDLEIQNATGLSAEQLSKLK